MKEQILSVIQDLVVKFTYYDRKEDEELTIENLHRAVLDGEITIDEMVKEFESKLSIVFKNQEP
ncbi:hypothetical protein [Reichenbachiella sp.]|uniref:hypothetical protein n=1 Tax=Reichenbachiella sp. TaxID=2184521 RepID=UPI003B5CA05D